MQNVLTALTDELRRLKAAGVKSVSVSDEALAGLRRVVMARAPSTGFGDPSGPGGPTARTVVAPRAVPAPEPPPRAAKPAVSLLPPPPVVSLPAGSKAERWAALRERVRTDPTCMAQVRPGKQVVFGVGNLDAQIMFVGEAPGADEEIQGEPFVGAAGQLLNRMILAMGVKREDVYIGNIMNWRPAMPVAGGGEQVGNRPPTPEEMAYCLPYLRAQIEVVAPAILVALGNTAAQGLLGAGTYRTLGEIRGQWKEFAGRPLIVTYHPSYILRNPTNRSKRLIWEDFLKVMARAALPVSEKQSGYFLDK